MRINIFLILKSHHGLACWLWLLSASALIVLIQGSVNCSLDLLAVILGLSSFNSFIFSLIGATMAVTTIELGSCIICETVLTILMMHVCLTWIAANLSLMFSLSYTWLLFLESSIHDSSARVQRFWTCHFIVGNGHAVLIVANYTSSALLVTVLVRGPDVWVTVTLHWVALILKCAGIRCICKTFNFHNSIVIWKCSRMLFACRLWADMKGILAIKMSQLVVVGCAARLHWVR